MLKKSHTILLNLWLPSAIASPPRAHPLENSLPRPRRSGGRSIHTCGKNGERSGNGDNDSPWPITSSSNGLPTPYEILGLDKTAPYKKSRFYELAKKYHPDRDIHEQSKHGSCLSLTVRLERYRLVVAAHEILSDPARRRAYDSCGAGWGGSRRSAATETSSSMRWSAYEYRYSPDSPANNATWEDWEAWYARRASARRRMEEQRPAYFSNGSVVVLVIAFALIGAATEIRRAERSTLAIKQQLELVHDEMSKELLRSRQKSQDLPTRDHIRKRFLKSRAGENDGEALDHGVADESASMSDLCMSAALEERGTRNT